MAEYLSSVKQVTETLLDFGCAKCFGGEVDFEMQAKVLADVEQAMGDNVARAITRATEIRGIQDDSRLLEEETAKGPPNALPEACLRAYKAFLGKEGFETWCSGKEAQASRPGSFAA